MMGALLHHHLISVPTIAVSNYLTSHSIRDLERERLLAVLKRHDWRAFSVSQELQTNVRTLYTQMKRLGIEPPRSGTNRKQKPSRNFDEELLNFELIVSGYAVIRPHDSE